MEILVIGLILFSMLHLIPSSIKLRSTLISSIGDKRYKVVFSIASLIAVVMIVYGFREAPDYLIYAPPTWGKTVTIILMFPAIYFFMSNSAGAAPSSAQALSAHPLSWGVILWSFAHLASNGNAAGVFIFATFLLFSIMSVLTGTKRGIKPRKDRRPPLSKELVFLMVVMLAYSALIWGHGYFTGSDVI